MLDDIGRSMAYEIYLSNCGGSLNSGNGRPVSKSVFRLLRIMGHPSLQAR